ncbi:cobalt-precorrin-6A reductase [Falsihalocynthiibacter sp. SS001]|uniref:cobalt-precorrin-6A reductase n=1 Tax=Falsihalocynthiibacter sp. SS001 TaxID=3349698 RepID=UPI0036D28AE3
MIKVLMLAGSGEARRLAALIASDQDVTAIASLAGATRYPTPLPLETRVGGFGGRAAQERYILREGFDLVVDATHPFAARISERTSSICHDNSIPYLHLRRAAWEPQEGDDWIMLNTPEEAKDHIPNGATVFLATGRGTLASFANLAGRHLICRQIDPPEQPFPFENGEYLIGKPPFSVEHEMDLFTDRKVDVLIVKNAGGAPSRTKLDAARRLGIKVLMIKRPPLPKGDHVSTVDAAMDWIIQHKVRTV